MAYEFARNLQDKLVNPSAATFTLPSALSLTTTSGVIDLETTGPFQPEEVELELAYPSITSTINPSANTAGVTFVIEASTTSTFAATYATLYSRTVAGGTVAANLAAGAVRCRLPSDCPRYVRGSVALGASAASASALNAAFTARF